MGLLETHSSTNKVRHQLPVTTVTRTLVFVGVPVGGTTDHGIYLERSVTHE